MTEPKEVTKEPVKLDIPLLTKELDWCMAQVFMGHNSAFLGSIMSSHNFIWDISVRSAQTNGVQLRWNPFWFLKLPRETRKTVLVHEMWHPARLHFLRMGDRDPKLWNWACDIRINNDLAAQGFTFEGTRPWIKRDLGDMVEEDIYDYLFNLKNQGSTDDDIFAIIGDGWDDMSIPVEDQHDPVDGGDMFPDMTEEDVRQSVNAVIMADQIARAGGEPGLGEGTERLILNQWLAPVVPWEQELQYWMQELLNAGRSWKRRNRRYQEMYMPSSFMDEGRLNHLMYFQDVSGSVTNADITRFNSEIYHIKTIYNPKKLTLVQFDDGITKVDIINEEDDFQEIEIKGRGGTNWEPVKAYIEEHKPTAAIIFTDMGFWGPITPLNIEIPVLWVAVNAGGQSAPFGRMVHIRG